MAHRTWLGKTIPPAGDRQLLWRLCRQGLPGMGMAEFDWLRRMASPGGELTRTSPNVRRVRSHLPAVYLDSQRAVQKRLKPRFTVTYCIPNRVHNIQSHFGLYSRIYG